MDVGVVSGGGAVEGRVRLLGVVGGVSMPIGESQGRDASWEVVFGNGNHVLEQGR